MKQLEDSVTAQAETVSTLSTNMNGISSTSGKTSDKKKERPDFNVCVHCKRKVHQKEENCFELEANKEKRYPGWKIVFTKEYYELGCAGSGVGVQSWLNTRKLKPTLQLRKYYTPLTIQVEELEKE